VKIMFLLSWLSRGENFADGASVGLLVFVLAFFKFIKALANQPVWPFGRGHHAPAGRCHALGQSWLPICVLAGSACYVGQLWPPALRRWLSRARPIAAAVALLQCPMPLLLTFPLRAMVGRLATPLTDAVCESRALGG
jgi:hypothetical protein